MHRRTWIAVLLATTGFFSATSADAQHRLILQGKDRLAVVETDGSISWEMPWGSIHDIHVLENGHVMVQQGSNRIAEIDPRTKSVVWTYDSARQNVVGDSPVEVHAFQPLKDGALVIAESGRGRIIEVDRQGKVLKSIQLKVDHPHPHTDTRLVRKLANDHYLVCHEGDGYVREYDDQGQVVWEYEVPLFGQERRDGHGPEAFGNKAFCAQRLANGNTLIATGNGHSVLEVTPGKEVVWKVAQNDLPGITLAWVTTLDVLPNGNYLIGNCHAGPENPQVIELDPHTKKVVWTFSEFDQFGNDVSNSTTLSHRLAD